MSLLAHLLGSHDQPSSHVLVVGATFAGMCAADTLLRSRAPIAVTLISPSLDFEFVPSALSRYLLPQPVNAVASPLLGRTFGFVQGTVISLSRNVARVNMVRRRQHKTAFLDSPKSYIEFDYCIWAVGETYPALPDRFPSFFFTGDSSPLATQSKVVSARSILVIGGGVAGVETAAELASLRNMGTRVTLATTDMLLPRLPERAQEYAQDWLLSCGVSLVSARVSASGSIPARHEDRSGGGRLFDCESGPASLSADIAIRCTRAHTPPTTSDAPDDDDDGVDGGGWRALAAGGVCAMQDITARGDVEVRHTLQLRRTANILVAGDVSLVPGELDRAGCYAEKTVYAAMACGRLAARNVVALDAGARRGDRAPVLERYPDHAFPLGVFPRLFSVALHDADACLCVGPLVITGRAAVFSRRITGLLGMAAVSGFRPLEIFFAICTHFIFFATALVQIVFGSFRD